jgi:transcriptional regulator with XRE-family HTH domain
MASIRDIDPTIGENIRKYREAQRLSQEKLGEMSDINEKTISAYECGTRRVPSNKLAVIAHALGVTTDDLFNRADRTERDELMDRIHAAILDVLKDYEITVKKAAR